MSRGYGYLERILTMQLPAGLLNNFFQGRCTEAEKRRVRAFLAAHPELLDDYCDESAWASFKAPSSLPAHVSKRMFGNVEAGIYKKAKLRSLIYKWISVAAVILICAGAGWWMMPAPANRAVVYGQVEKADPLIPQTEWKVNTTDKTIAVVLPDGSRVELSPLSEIRYSPGFKGSARDIYLKGTALFTVVSSKTKPFTVYAGGLGTTALGTTFRVSERPNGFTRVELLEGKVVVRPDSMMARKGIAEKYLKPGQQLNLDQRLWTISVRQRTTSPKTTRLKTIVRFANQPLAAVIHTLETSHHLKFVYANGSLDELNFTGVFNENKETVDDFMQTICLLNNLSMEKQKDSIRIVQNR